MSRTKAGTVIVLCLLLTGLLAAAASDVVTNPPPAVTATMQLLSFANGAFVWNVRGKVKPAYRGFGATVRLVCLKYAELDNGVSPVVFPADHQNNVDACGNFSFN